MFPKFFTQIVTSQKEDSERTNIGLLFGLGYELFTSSSKAQEDVEAVIGEVVSVVKSNKTAIQNLMGK